jgi:hypothetical protein
VTNFASIDRRPSASFFFAFLLACLAFWMFAPAASAQNSGGPGHSRQLIAQLLPESTSTTQSTAEAAAEAEAEAQFEAELEEAELEEAGGSTTTSSPRASHSGTTEPAESRVVTVSGLRLTHQTVAALSSRRVQPSQVHFAFTLSARAAVRVSLQEEVIRGGQVSWRKLPDSVTVAGKHGANAGQLRARGSLSSGFYKLTVAPAHSAGKSVFMRVP